jgi:aminoglycoside phosphotransferase (APT) family kinase protein
MPADDMPVAEVDVDAELVRSLLEEQCPDLAALDLALVANGWDNAIFRLGDELTVRMPRRALSAVLVEHEQQWLPGLAERLPLPIPAPVRCGRPGLGYPWSWSVCPWLRGAIAERVPPDDPVVAAEALGGFLRALHVDAPPDAPANPYRGVPLAERDDVTRQRADQVAGLVDRDAVVACWEALLTTPAWVRPPRWLHGDLHPANVLVDGGRIAAIIDFGDITAGDPATDLSVAWMLLPPDARSTFRVAVGGVDDDTWSRARAWALSLGLAYVAGSADNPMFSRLGQRVVAQALAG